MDAATAALVSTALFELAKKLAEKAGLDSSLEKGLKPLNDWLTVRLVKEKCRC